MSTFTYGPALESEIGYRREGLLRDAAATRMAGMVRRTRRRVPALRATDEPTRSTRVATGTVAETTVGTTAGIAVGAAADSAAGTVAVPAAGSGAADQVVRAA